MLVLVQVGLYFGFMDTASSIIDASHADIWVGKQGNESFEFATPFDERAFYKVASVPGVERAERVLMNFAQFKLADGGDLGVQVVGIETYAGRAVARAVERGRRRSRAAARARRDRRRPQRVREARASTTSVTITEVSGVRARGRRDDRGHPLVHDLADRVRRHPHRAQLHAAARRRARSPTCSSRSPPASPSPSVKARINALPHLAAYTTRADVRCARATYWSTRTGVGAGFFTTAVLGVIVGFVVVGQILYSGTLQYIREYGTLKAMGAKQQRGRPA